MPEIIGSSDLRRRFKEVLEAVEREGQPYYIIQRGRAAGVFIRAKDYEAMSREAAEAKALEGALRWSLSFIVNVSLSLWREKGHRPYLSLLQQGVEEEIRRANVPRGIMTSVDTVEEILREWDYKTFRTEQQTQVTLVEGAVAFKHTSCPPLLETMRQHAPFVIKRVNIAPYRAIVGDAIYDFLCLSCNLCRETLLSWLSEGRFSIVQFQRTADDRGRRTCSYVVGENPARTA